MGQRVVEELDDEDDDDIQGVGLASFPGNSRFISDALRFTGLDLGGSGNARSCGSYIQQRQEGEAEDDDDTSEDSDSEEDLGYEYDEEEEALVESALARVRRAQAKGKREVKLSKEELAALERRRQRMEGEGRRRKRKEKEPRIAVPLSQLEPTSRKRRPATPEDTIQHQSIPGTFHEDREPPNYPPMGYFPPPLASTRVRPRSGTSTSQRRPSRDPDVDRSRGSSPLRYSYLQQPTHLSTDRHVPDTAAGPRSRGPTENSLPSNLYGSAASASASAPSIHSVPRYPQNPVDPFQYMTAGPNVLYHIGSGPVRRPASGPPGDMTDHTNGPGAATTTARGVLGRRGSDGTSEETSDDVEEESSRDRHGQLATVGSSGSGPAARTRGRNREDIIVIEDSPEPEPDTVPSRHEREREVASSSARPSTKKTSSASSPPGKRKPVASSGSTRRRKAR